MTEEIVKKRSGVGEGEETEADRKEGERDTKKEGGGGNEWVGGKR